MSKAEKDNKISVCMATYNGGGYIKEQLKTVLSQLKDGDEIIIVDDASADDTVQIIRGFQDSRINLIVNNRNCGINRSFELAIQQSKGKYIFLCDQDDLWCEERVNVMCKYLENYLLVSGNTIAIDAAGNRVDYSFGKLRLQDSCKYTVNIMRIIIGKAYYYGCAMAFEQKMKEYILPFPERIESHDLYIAIAANLLKSNCHIEEIVLQRRIHGKNASVIQRPLMCKLKSRILFLEHIRYLKGRIRL